MKKFIILALTALMCFSLAACGSNEQNSQPAETDTDITENVSSAEDIAITGSVEEIDGHPGPKVQDIRKFLEQDTPYDTAMGTFGSMDFLFSLEHGDETMMRQFMDILVEDYGLSLVDVYTYDYETATFKYYQYMYSGDGEDKLERENMDWDMSVGITVHKDSTEVVACVSYVNGFELVDDGHRADYSKVVRPVFTPEPNQKPASQNTGSSTDEPPPKIQDIRNFLSQDTPYDIAMGTFGSMDFLYSLEHGEEELIQQFIDTLVIGGYGLNLVDVNKYDYESASYKSYDFMYRGEGEKKLQRENMNWDVSVSITVHKDSTEVVAGIFYVNGFELVDDGHRADYHKVDTPTPTPSPTPVPKPAAPSDGNNVPANKDSNGGGTTPHYERNELPDHSKLQCLTCRGSGDCKDCGGSIYVYVGGARTKCNGCKGSGDCRTCGGSGTR